MFSELGEKVSENYRRKPIFPKILLTEILKSDIQLRLDMAEATLDSEIPMEDSALAVERQLQHNNFTIRTQKLDYIAERIGLLGDHAILTITIWNTVKNQERTLSFFVKLFPKSEALAMFARETAAFTKEEFSYQLFEEFEKAGIAIIRQCAAKSYVVKPGKYLILENLSISNFTINEKSDLLDYDKVTAVLQSLAKLHACSLIYEESLSKCISANGNQDILRDRLYGDYGEEGAIQDQVESTLKCILTEIQLFQFPQVLKTGKSVIETTREMLPKMFQLLKPSSRYRNVFCHGDLWAGNFLIKPGKPIQCKLVDFQMCRYVPPAHDVMSLIFLNTSRDFRQNHLYELLGIYYNCLEKIMKIFDYKLAQFISFDHFLESCEEQKLFAVVFTAAILPLVLSRRDKLQQYFSDEELYRKVFREDRSQLVFDSQEDEVVMGRMRESIEDLLEQCDKFR